MRIADELQVDCPVFYVDNVAEYYVSMGFGEGVNWNGLPRVLPPFLDMWVEFKTTDATPFRYEVGSRLRTYDVTDDDRTILASTSPECAERACRMVGIDSFWRAVGYQRIIKANTAVAWIDEEGGLIGFQYKYDHENQAAPLRVVALAISFMHCKNVRRVEHATPPKLAKAQAKRGRKPHVKCYTLDIDPMKEILRREGGIEKNGLPKALHICRGHFATYTAEKPAFGKAGRVGTWWRPAMVRGTEKAGVVVKDYAVKAPDGAKQ